MSVGYEIHLVAGDTVLAELWYPRSRSVKFVEVGLVDVRAADSVRLTYDFERDGWSVQQASRFEWAEGEDPDPDWQEVAFVQAWAREQNQPPGQIVAKNKG